jgi:hypothetical protein
MTYAQRSPFLNGEIMELERPFLFKGKMNALPGQKALLEITSENLITVCANRSLNQGYFYYEVKLMTAGNFAIGWQQTNPRIIGGWYAAYNGFLCKKFNGLNSAPYG